MEKLVVFVVEHGEEEVQTWVIEDGADVYCDGQHLKRWRPFRKGRVIVGMYIYEGNHQEYGDRDESVFFDDEDANEFFTLDKARAEALAERNRQSRLRYEQREALFEAHGLDDATIKKKRAALLQAHKLNQ